MILPIKLPFSQLVTSTLQVGKRLSPARQVRRNEICVRTARTREDLAAAFKIVQRRYEETGLARSNVSSLRVLPYHLSPASQIFVATVSGQVVGTVTLVRDSTQGLPIASSYPGEISQLRCRSGRIGEITSLAVDLPLATRTSKARIFTELTRLMTFFARSEGIEYLTAVVHPRHAKFYRLAMGFEVIGGETAYAPVGGKPGVAILGSVNDASRYRPRWRNYYFNSNFTSFDLAPRKISSRDQTYFDQFTETVGLQRAA